jgi:hypothetical protein
MMAHNAALPLRAALARSMHESQFASRAVDAQNPKAEFWTSTVNPQMPLRQTAVKGGHNPGGGLWPSC